MMIGSSQRRAYSAFTLIEILIVVVILGILAGIVTTQVIGASRDARETALRENLRIIRSQLIVYRQLHATSAGFDGSGNAVAASQFKSQLVQFTNINGDTAADLDSTHTIRPCLSVFPTNPMTSTNDVLLTTGSATTTCDGSTAWIYNLDTQEFFANSTQYGPGGLNW